MTDWPRVPAGREATTTPAFERAISIVPAFSICDYAVILMRPELVVRWDCGCFPLSTSVVHCLYWWIGQAWKESQ